MKSERRVRLIFLKSAISEQGYLDKCTEPRLDRPAQRATPLLLGVMAMIDVLPTTAETGLAEPAHFPGRNVLIRGDLVHISKQPIRQNSQFYRSSCLPSLCLLACAISMSTSLCFCALPCINKYTESSSIFGRRSFIFYIHPGPPYVYTQGLPICNSPPC